MRLSGLHGQPRNKAENNAMALAQQALRSTLPTVLVSLSREASERGEPVAAGLLNMITQFKFIATLFFYVIFCPT